MFGHSEQFISYDQPPHSPGPVVNGLGMAVDRFWTDKWTVYYWYARSDIVNCNNSFHMKPPPPPAPGRACGQRTRDGRRDDY